MCARLGPPSLPSLLLLEQELVDTLEQLVPPALHSALLETVRVVAERDPQLALGREGIEAVSRMLATSGKPDKRLAANV